MKIAARFLSIVKCHPFDKLRMTLSPPKGQLLIVSALFSILLTLSTKSAFAAPGGPPNPQPCKNVETGPLTDNWITDENGNPPVDQVLSRTGDPGETLTVTLNAAFTV